MDALLARIGAQAMKMAIGTGISYTSKYAIQQYSRLVKSVDDKPLRQELKALQKLLDSKIKIITPIIDLIEFRSGRGNVFLESAVPLTKTLHRDIVSLGRRLQDAVESDLNPSSGPRTDHTPEGKSGRLLSLKKIIAEIKDLLARIDRDIPLLQLAISASGETLSHSLSAGISPSRLLQASTFLIIGDTQFASDPTRPAQIGPAFNLSLYMLFVGHGEVSSKNGNNSISSHTPVPSSEPTTPKSTRKLSRDQGEEPYGLGEGDRKPIWQEVLHKARVRICRTPIGYNSDSNQGYRANIAVSSQYGLPDEYAYYLEIIEDLNDGRKHDERDLRAAPFEEIQLAGIRESIPLHQLSKIFYTDTGRILNIGNADDPESNPVLLLKRDKHVKPPQRMLGPNGFPVQQNQARTNGHGLLEDARSSSSNFSTDSEERDEELDSEEDQDEQDDIDRQIRSESQPPSSPPQLLPTRQLRPIPVPFTKSSNTHSWNLPPHLDPEWLAFEVFAEDDDADSDSSETIDDMDSEPEVPDSPSLRPRVRPALNNPRQRSSLDNRLIEQIRNISLRGPQPQPDPELSSGSNSRPGTSGSGRPSSALPTPSKSLAVTPAHQSPAAFAQRSPFGAVITSLSLLEMLVRLTALQEFQQTSHLAIPDHVLTFFLEQTSTTGVRGLDRWQARAEAKRKVGFDPYTDTPTQ